MFLFYFMRNLARSQVSRVISTTVWRASHIKILPFSYLSVYIHTCVSLPPYVSSPFLPQEMSGKPLGFTPPLIKLIPIELLRYHPRNKGPVLSVFVRPDVQQVLTWPGRKEKGKGKGGEIKGRGGGGVEWVWGGEGGARTTSVVLIFHLICICWFSGVCFTNCLP